MNLAFKNSSLNISHPIVMGILNVTPDSFSDGGCFVHKGDALKQAQRMVEEGAAILDVGGESTRPDAGPVSVQQELDRVLPVIEGLVDNFDLPISIDTSKAAVMRAAVEAGASMINDVCALRNEGALQAAVEAAVPICLMHMQGQPKTMQDQPHYENVSEDVKQFLLTRAKVCHDAGISKEHIILDPGFGFGKTLAHNLCLLRDLEQFSALGYPLLIGVSRKRMIAAILGHAPEVPISERMIGSLAAAMIGVGKGAHIIRTHNVLETVEACKIYTAVQTTFG